MHEIVPVIQVRNVPEAVKVLLRVIVQSYDSYYIDNKVSDVNSIWQIEQPYGPTFKHACPFSPTQVGERPTKRIDMHTSAAINQAARKWRTKNVEVSASSKDPKKRKMKRESLEAKFCEYETSGVHGNGHTT
jgi:hypothetical protein